MFEIKRVTFDVTTPADDNRAFAAQLSKHFDRIQIQDRRKEEANIINHDNPGV